MYVTYAVRSSCIFLSAASGSRNLYTQSRYSATKRWKIPCARAVFCVALNLQSTSPLQSHVHIHDRLFDPVEYPLSPLAISHILQDSLKVLDILSR